MKKQRDDLEFVRHMLEYSEEALGYAFELSIEEFLKDRKTQRATLYCIQTVGEAAGKISPEFRIKNPEIAWKQIKGMRNILVHVYHGVDPAVVLKTVQKELHNLIRQLKIILGE